MRVYALVLCALFALTSPAGAQEDTPARLQNLPDEQALSDHFPPIALTNGISGRALVRCEVAADGDSDCSVIEADPADWGFGDAAARLSENWRFTPATANGSAVESTRDVTVRFPNQVAEPLIIYPELHVRGVRGNVAADEDGARFYPQRAHVEGMTGRALIACAARSDRSLDCAVEREAPEGFGFGEAAVRIISNSLPADSPGRAPNAAFRAAIQFDFRAESEGDNPSRWERRPLEHDIANHYPRDQLLAGVGGRVMLGCRIRANRTLNCDVLEEEPGGVGFGAAAVVISREFLLSGDFFGQPGLAENDRITMPIRFVAP
jgi:TonB family protein